ncbi:MAG: hypothetical protein AB1424_12795 [Thermodesulfobacteriota bacterium]
MNLASSVNFMPGGAFRRPSLLRRLSLWFAALSFLLPALAFFLYDAPAHAQRDAGRTPARPAATGLSAFNNLNAAVVGIKFFPGSKTLVPYGQRQYTDKFDAQSATFIFWQLDLEYPPGVRAKIAEFPITAIWYDPAGKVFNTQTFDAKVQPHWRSSVHAYGFGYRTPGFWKPGTYRVILKVGDKTLASGSFQVVASRKQEGFHYLNATVAGIRFFPSPKTVVPYGQRQYTDKFDAQSTPYIYWELSLDYPGPRTHDVEFPITQFWYDPDGKILLTDTVTHLVPAAWSGSYLRDGYGTAAPGFWKPGTYRVILKVGDKTLASGSFQVVSSRKQENFHYLQATVTGIKFFPSPKTIVPYGQRQYADKFDAQSTPYICWELSLDHQGSRAHDVEFPITQFWYDPDGKIFFTDTIKREVPADRSSSRIGDGYGAAAPGFWKPGNYRVILKVGDKTLASGSFQVVAPEEPEGFNYLHPKVTGIKFYPAKGKTGVPHGQREFADTFDKETSYIFWELSLDHPGPRAKAVEFPITAVWYDPDGKIGFTDKIWHEVQPDARGSLITGGRWSPLFYVYWGPGTYRVVLKVDDKIISSGSFQVEEKQDVLEKYGAKVTSLRFYEEGPTPIAFGKRNYQEQFPASATRYIGWELRLNWPPGKRTQRLNFPLSATWYGPDGKVLTTQTLKAESDPGQQESLHGSGYGAATPGTFKSGRYRVILKSEDRELAEGIFYLYGPPAGAAPPPPEPAPGDVAAFNNLQATVKGIKFYPAYDTSTLFPGSKPGAPYGQRQYAEKFDCGVDFIFWELSLEHPGPRAKVVEFPLTAIWYDPAGKILLTETIKFEVQPDSNASLITGKCAGPRKQLWNEGTYQVILKVGDKTISSGTFTMSEPY